MNRNYLAVWPSMFLVSMGLMAVLPTLPLYIEERFGITDPEEVRFWAGVIFGAGPLSAACVGPLWGALSDRVGRRVMILRSIFAIGLVMALMPLAGSPWMLAFLRVLQGLFAGYVAPAFALVSTSVPAERQARTLAGLQVALASGLLFGPVLGAEIAALLSRGDVFYVTSGLCLLSAVPILLFAREDRTMLRAKDERTTPFLPRLFAEMVEPLRHRPFAILLVLILVLRLGLNMVEPFLSLWVRELGALPWLSVGATSGGHALDRTTALAFTILAVAQFACTPIWGRLADRFGPLRCLAAVALSVSVVLFLTATVTSIGSYLWLRIAAAVFMSGSMTLAYAAAARRVGPSQRTLAFSLVQSCIQFGLALGPILGGLFTTGASVRGLFPVAASLLAVAGVGMVVLRVTTQRARQEPVVSPPVERL